MRGALLVGCMVLAACDDGIVIEVRAHPDVPSDEVELFLGLEKCHDCGPIQPELAPAPLTGDVYFRDGATTFVAKMENGVARFRIEPGDAGSELQTIVAVGMTGTRQNAAALLPGVSLDGAQRWIVQLEPAAMELRTSNSTEGGDFVKVWREELDPRSSCIAFERWTAPDQVSRKFIVPKHDPDCDDFTEDSGECNAYAHDGGKQPELHEVSCTLQDNSGTNGGPCLLGGRTCIDGRAPEDCGASDYCIPDALCQDACANATTHDELRACLGASFATTGQISPVITCELPVDLTTDLPCGAPDAMENVKVAVTLDVQFPLGCENPELAVVSSQGMTAGGTLDVFEKRVTIKTGETRSFTLKALEPLPPSGPMPGCQFALEWAGQVDPEVTRTSAVALKLTGATTGKHLLLPVDIQFQRVTCDVVGKPEAHCFLGAGADASIFQCAK